MNVARRVEMQPSTEPPPLPPLERPIARASKADLRLEHREKLSLVEGDLYGGTRQPPGGNPVLHRCAATMRLEVLRLLVSRKNRISPSGVLRAR